MLRSLSGLAGPVLTEGPQLTGPGTTGPAADWLPIGTYASRAAQLFGQRPAFVDGDRSVTFRDMEAGSNRLAHGLMALGVNKGDRVLLVLPDCYEWFEFDLALAKIGAVTVALSPRTPTNELERAIGLTAPTATIMSASTNAAKLPIQKGGLQIVLGRAWDPGQVEYSVLLRKGTPMPVPVVIQPGIDLRLIRMTSGTTGTAKAVCLTHRNWLTAAFTLLLDRYALTEGDIFLGGSPYPHASGAWLLAALMRGAAVLVRDSFDPEYYLRAASSGTATVMQMVPTMLRRLLDLPGLRKADLSRLRVVSYGSGPADGELVREAFDVLGPRLVQGYGLNEAPNVLVLRATEHERMLDQFGRRQPVGREATMAEARIADPKGSLIENGGPGELVVRGSMVMQGYWRDPGATQNVIRGGWLHTGDLAERDEEGFLYLVGRLKDVIITGGFNVNPVEVEDVLRMHDNVSDCAVVGLPDREWGERVTAFIVARAGLAPAVEVLRDHCRNRLAGYKVPKDFRIVDSLPRTENGKVIRDALRNVE